MLVELPVPTEIVDGSRISSELRLSCDVCVIGSGAGGAPVAAALARGGARVVVLEEGPSVDVSQLNGNPSEMLGRLYRDGGQTLTLGNTPIMVPVGKVVGGTTLVNSGTCLRTPDEVLSEWSAGLGLEQLGAGSLDRWYAEVEETIGVARVSPGLAGRNADIIREAAGRLGWSSHYLPRNARGCVGSGVCAFGCPTGAKQHTAVTYLSSAREDGATTYSGVRARKLRIERGRVRGAVAVADGGGRVEIEAGKVVVAAGTFHTPGLLAASGLRNRWLGRNLSIHPATAAWGVLDQEVDMSRGVPQSLAIDEFASQGLMLEGISGPPAYLAMSVPYSGPEHRDLMLSYKNVAQFGLMIRDSSRGRVAVGAVARRSGSPVLRYDVGREDLATLKVGIERLAELLFAAGAKRVMLPVVGLPELRDGEIDRLRQLRLHPSQLKLMAFHPLGTARMAANEADGIVDGNGRVHGVDGLYVADGSAVPSSLGVNPQLTIMALAIRLGHHLLKE